MKHASFNHVRTFRKRHALSEEELAFLMQQRAQSSVAQFENGDRVPNLAQALALQVLFGQQPRHLFPALYESVEEDVMRKAASLLAALDAEPGKRSATKREFLEDLARYDSDRV